MSEHLAFALMTTCRGKDSEPVTTTSLDEFSFFVEGFKVLRATNLQPGETATLEVTRLSEQDLAEAREVAELDVLEGETR